MTFEPHHIALFFGQSNLDEALTFADDPLLQAARDWLTASAGVVIRQPDAPQSDSDPTLPPIVKPALSGLPLAQTQALMFRFQGDESAGRRATQTLLQTTLEPLPELIPAIQQLILMADIAEMVSDHAAFTPHRDAWLDEWGRVAGHVAATDNADPIAGYWLITLRIVAGVLLDNPDIFAEGVADFQAVINRDIHPEGYFKPLSDPPAGYTFARHLEAVRALTLAAEAATQAGVDLWAYNIRDVSLNTAVTYIVYYYFYPDKWRWGTPPTDTDVQEQFRQSGAMIEIVTYHGYPRGVELLLEDQRPLYDPFGGGLTTLTHFATKGPRDTKKKRGGLFSLFGG